MIPPIIMPKSEMLRRSMRCRTLAWWSLIPVVGLVPGVLAFSDFFAVLRGRAGRWNPASLQWFNGVVVASVGVLLTLLFLTIVAVNIVTDSGW